MPLITGPAIGTPSAVYGGTGGSLGAKAFYLGRGLLRRTPQALVLTLAGNAIYYVLTQLNDQDNSEGSTGVSGGGGASADFSSPPMWARDP